MCTKVNKTVHVSDDKMLEFNLPGSQNCNKMFSSRVSVKKKGFI
jgi:hypothetical protein